MTGSDQERDLLLKTFLNEAEESLIQFEQLTVALEQNPSKSEILQDLFRISHTLKGNASILGFEQVADFTHTVENVLHALREKKISLETALISALLSSVDVVRAMLHDAVTGEKNVRPEFLRLKTDLQSRCSGKMQVIPDEPLKTLEITTEETESSKRTLRVGLEKLDRLLNLTGEMVISRERLRNLLAGLRGKGEIQKAYEAFLQDDRLYSELQETIHHLRLVPIGPVLRNLVRTVRDLALVTEKQVRLKMEGMDVEVDTAVVERLRDSVMHLVRNAVSHGIEDPHVRKKNGKDPCGLIILKAYHESGSVVIELKDDGAGFDLKKIRERGAKRFPDLDIERLSKDETLALVFEPGFSTKDEVSELSGRGVGMDVVKRNVETLRGTLTIQSDDAKGACVCLRLPLTLAIIDGLIVEVGSERYVIPIDSVVECLDLPAVEGERHLASGICQLRGNVLPYLRLRQVFNLQSPLPARECVVAVRYGNKTAGLAVDRLQGSSRTVIKPLGGTFCQVSGVSGSTILGDGRVALILDVPTLMKGVFA